MMNFEQSLSSLFKQKSNYFSKIFFAPTAVTGHALGSPQAPALFKDHGQQSKPLPPTIWQHDSLES